VADIVSVKGTAVGSSTATATARVKHSFSRQHMFAAEIFAAEAGQIEGQGAGAGQESLNRHRACVTASIFSSVAFLESSINELYHSAESRDHTALAGLPDEVLALLAEFWSEVEWSSILHKYQLALLVSRADLGEHLKPAIDGHVKTGHHESERLRR